MNLLEPTPDRLLRATVEDSSQVAPARSVAVDLARQLGLPPRVVDQLALVATELAENLYRHAVGGELLVVLPQPGGEPSVRLMAVDRGPGVAGFERCLVDGFSTTGTLGGGLGAAQRLTASFDAVSEPGYGTVVCTSFTATGRPPVSTTPFDVAAVGFPVLSETVNGDAFAFAQRGSRLLVMVADGLGHGRDAARASNAATAALAGLSEHAPSVVLGEVNGRIAATRGAAVSVACLEVDAARLGGEVVTSGLGNVSVVVAAPDGSSRRVMTAHGTAGARPHTRTLDHRTPFPAHGTLVLHSDGLTSRWTLEGRAELLRHSAQVIAAALWRDHERGGDDSMVLVAKSGR